MLNDVIRYTEFQNICNSDYFSIKATSAIHNKNNYTTWPEGYRDTLSAPILIGEYDRIHCVQ